MLQFLPCPFIFGKIAVVYSSSSYALLLIIIIIINLSLDECKTECMV